MNTLFGQDVIKSISFDEGEILRSIRDLHCPDWIELDPCYSTGRFYDEFGLPTPKLKFDINPQSDDVLKADASQLPLTEGSVNSIMFDPPFLSTSGEVYDNHVEGSNIIANRFSAFKTMDELWGWYADCLLEFKRILKPNGVLVFKNQDAVSSAKQYFSHCYIMNVAAQMDMYPKDLFILLAKQRIIGGNHSIQQHARKFHCYYWVFVNRPSRVDYILNDGR